MSKVFKFAGYVIDSDSEGPHVRRTYVKPTSGDYGADPLGDGTYRMVPSGDVVDWEERCRRLSR